MDACDVVRTEHPGKVALLATVYSVFGLCQFGFLCLCWSIIEVKRATDCLQGINKLDYLLKVSEFQVYKDRPTMTTDPETESYLAKSY